jgi:adenosylcobyric acid synthase
VRLDSGASDGCVSGHVWGSYLHGFFDTESCRRAVLNMLCHRKGLDESELTTFDYKAYKERQYDLLADAVRANLNMDLIYRILEEGVTE